MNLDCSLRFADGSRRIGLAGERGDERAERSDGVGPEAVTASEVLQRGAFHVKRPAETITGWGGRPEAITGWERRPKRSQVADEARDLLVALVTGRTPDPGGVKIRFPHERRHP